VLTDAEVPPVWQGLGLPGLLDVHVHFLPEPVMRKVWAYFDDASHYGVQWPITYRTSEDDRLARLRALGVRRFPALVYPHKPGMAAWLNDWAAGFAAQVPEVWPTFTFYPEEGVERYVVAALDAGARIGKAHLQVGSYDPREPVLQPVWGLLAESGIPVVVHCASGPVGGPYTGPGPFGEVLADHPRLTAVIAHLGMPEYAEFFALAARYPNVHLDTTMAFTEFTERRSPFPADLRPRLVDLADRICFGSDFPNIPHTYAHQIEVLQRLDLGDDWLRRVLWGNTARLLDVDFGGTTEQGDQKYA